MATAKTHESKGPDAGVHLKNPHLAELSKDTLYHLGFDSSMPLKKMFSDVKLVFFGGSGDRMLKIASVVEAAYWPNKIGSALAPIGSTYRYSFYKTGPVLCISHGMGMPSFSILLHEVAKLLRYAEATDVCFVRVGTSGGVGIPGGTIVVTNRPLNGFLKPEHEIVSLGKAFKRPSSTDSRVRALLTKSCKDAGVPTVEGDTMSVDCFYEGQGRLDGAICGYDEKDKLDFLKRARDEGVRNIEMESSMYGAFCEELGIPAGCVCLALLNRLEGDQVDIPAEKYAKWMNDLMAVCVSFVGNLLAIKPVADSASASGDAQKQYSSVLSRAAAPSGTH